MASDYETLIPSLLTSPISSNLTVNRQTLQNNTTLRQQILNFIIACNKADEYDKALKKSGGSYTYEWTCSYPRIYLDFTQMIFLYRNYILNKYNDLSRVLILALEVEYNRLKGLLVEMPNYVYYTDQLNSVIDTTKPITDAEQISTTLNISQQNIGTYTTAPIPSFDGTGSIFGSSLWTETSGGIYYNSGVVGIGTSTPNTSYNLHVVGDSLIEGNLCYTSDVRLKKNIQPLSRGIDGLRPVEYEWKDGRGHDMGFIAQETEEVVPELVKTAANGIKSVNYMKIISLLVKEVQELKSRQ